VKDSYVVLGLILKKLLDHGLNDVVKLALNVGIVELAAHLVFIRCHFFTLLLNVYKIRYYLYFLISL
jgi:hypothetical protein